MLDQPDSISEDPLVRSLGDVARRIEAYASSACRRRFAVAAREWFGAMQVETANRIEQSTPGLEPYLRLRQISVGMYTEFALMDVTHQQHTGATFWCEPEARSLMGMAANLIAWQNDVFSFAKERAVAEPHNLVWIIQDELQLTESAAKAWVIELHNREMRGLLALLQGARGYGMSSPRQFENLAELACSWIRGNLDWSLTSPRYG